MRKTIITLLLIAIVYSSSGQTKIVSWNAREVFSVQEVKNRRDHFKDFADDIKPDIVLLQEITSYYVLREIRNQMGLDNFHIQISNFNPNDNGQFASFEVGIISRYPLSKVIEYDPQLDGEDQYVKEKPLFVPDYLDIPETGEGRGFLWIVIDDIELNLSIVHLKSSRGDRGNADKNNAARREHIMAGLAAKLASDVKVYEGYSHLVAGDFNVGHSDKKKNGTNINSDCYRDCGEQDWYDETHALLSGGLVSGLRMKNLLLSEKKGTYVGYEDQATPIDNIYVTGDVKKFSKGVRHKKTYDSDHYPVSTTYNR